MPSSFSVPNLHRQEAMPRLNDQLGAELDQLRGDGLYRQLRTIASAQGPRVVIDGREFLNFSSNDYLGLANDPILKRAATGAVEKYGVGAGASRLVSGNLAPYAELEARLARFKGKEAAIVFGSGYVANLATIAALVGEGDVVILDKLDHASIIDGARLSGATIRVYPHKNLKKLEDVLRQTHAARRTLIVTETVFSMDGDLAPLAEIVALKEKYGAWLMIDEAHATGLYGQHRRGLAEPLGLEDHIDVTLGTLSKALGCVGGYVAGAQTLIDYLRNRARGLIYSTALPPAMVAAGSAAVEFVMSEEGQRRRDLLWRNVSELKNGLAKLGVQNESRSPIIPIVVGDERAAVELSRQLYDRGIFVPAIRYPTVPKGKARLRVTVTAGHAGDEMGRFLEVFASASRGRNAAPTIATDEAGQSVGQGQVGATFLSRPGEVVEEKPHSRALRKGRASVAGDCYFLTTCVDGKRAVLADPAAAKIVIDALRWLRERGRIWLLGFVVMPDHIHVALALRWQESRQECRSHQHPRGGSDIPVATLAELMKVFKGYASREICRRLGVATPLWQEGYHDHRLRDKRDFLKKLEYMHENPLRKGLVKHVSEYPFSTAHPDYEKEIDWLWYEGIKP